jgi:hypothetical protein
MLKPNLMIGADPEVFIKDPKHNKFFSALTSKGAVIEGTKKLPFPHEAGAVQIDGVALEFNTIPSNNVEGFVSSIKGNLAFLSSRLRDFDPNLILAIVPTAEFSSDYFAKLPPEAKELGCDPDFDAYTGEVNTPPETDKPFRTGSGHVHVGWTKGYPTDDQGHVERCRDVTRQLDVALFLPSLLYDHDTLRRSLYGNPGAFRPKSYGVEYRVLSNRWLRNEYLQRWVFRTTQRAVTDLVNGRPYFKTITEDLIKDAAVHSHEKSTRKYIKSLATKYPEVLELPQVV